MKRYAVAAAEWSVLLPLWRRLFKSRGWRIAAASGTAFAWLVAVAAIAGAGGGGEGDDEATQRTTTRTVASAATVPASTRAPTAQPTPEPTPPPTPPPTPAGPATTFGSGTKTVGQDIAPGTYRGNLGGGFCYYARLSGFSGEIGDIITNGNTNAPEIVTIAPTDIGFNSERCGEWAEGLTGITPAPTAPFEDGTFAVGLDIAPGTWSAPGGDSCYFARLAGFGQTIDDIITNDVGSSSPIVTIAATDAGFSSQRCGGWTLQ